MSSSTTPAATVASTAAAAAAPITPSPGTTTPSAARETTFRSFSRDQGAAYAQYRRDYHLDVYKTILDRHRSTGGRLKDDDDDDDDTVLLDVGCGPGMATRALAPYFSRTIGVDPSEGMITTARSLPLSEPESYQTNPTNSHTIKNEDKRKNIQFEVSTIESLHHHTLLSSTLPPGSVDLITSANAAHWFDMSIFWRQAARLLRPGGSVAIWGSGPIVFDPDVQPGAKGLQEALERVFERLGDCLLEGNRVAQGLYRDLEMPWTVNNQSPKGQDSKEDRLGVEDGEKDKVRGENTKEGRENESIIGIQKEGGDIVVEDDALAEINPASAFDPSTFFRKEWSGIQRPGTEEEAGFFKVDQPADLRTLERVLGTTSPVVRWRERHPELAETERDPVKMMRREMEEVLKEALRKEPGGVVQGEDQDLDLGRVILKGGVRGVVLVFKKNA